MPDSTAHATGYIRPEEDGPDWYETTTTVWRLDELRTTIQLWKHLLDDDGYEGSRSGVRPDTAFTGKHSVFPAPVVERILLRYGGPEGGLILDAFAGGPPRGAVSALMGYRYLGYEVRKEQIDENLAVMQGLGQELGIKLAVDYRCSDGTLLEGCAPGSVDCAVTSPPYYDLEQYSNLPDDLSNQSSYSDFDAAMERCAEAHRRVMKPGAFVCIVTAPFRLMTNVGVNTLVDLPGHTVTNFVKADFNFWQKIILVKNPGSAGLRARNYWEGGRKLVPSHEELLVFRTPFKE